MDRDRPSSSRILETLNSWTQDRGERVIIVLDKLRELIRLKGYDILPSIAYAMIT